MKGQRVRAGLALDPECKGRIDFENHDVVHVGQQRRRLHARTTRYAERTNLSSPCSSVYTMYTASGLSSSVSHCLSRSSR